jgi:hypothetical protein
MASEEHTQEIAQEKKQEHQEISEEESDYSDDSELSSESSSDEEVKLEKVEVKQSPSLWNRANSWFLSHREASVAILFGIAAIGIALTYRSNSK